MLDFQSVRDKTITFGELTANVDYADLAGLTHEIVEMQLALLADCADDDVTFVPADPDAHDPYAQASGDSALAWTL
ncbi:MAG: DinB family protein, partial [Caldilineaceae bacterium]